MGFLDSTANRAGEQIRQGEWIDAGAHKLTTQVIPKMPLALQSGSTQAVTRIVSGKGSIGVLTSSKFAAVVGYFGLGMEDEARLLYLREHASHVERQSAIVTAARGAYAGHETADAAWTEVKAIALDVLRYAGQAAIPLLLAMM